MADYSNYMFRLEQIATLKKRIVWQEKHLEELRAKLAAERVAQQQECYPWEGLDGPINTMGLGTRMTNALAHMCRRPYPEQSVFTVRSVLAFDWDDPFIVAHTLVGEKTVAAVKLWMENNREKCDVD